MSKKLGLFIGGVDRFALGVFNTDSGVFSKYTSVDLSELEDISAKKAAIQDLVNANETVLSDTEDCVFALDNINTLVPNELFSNTSPKEIIKFNFGSVNDDPDYNRIAEQGIVNVFEFPLWIKSFLVIKFPHVSLNHLTTVRIKQVFNFPTFKEKTYIFRNASSIEIIRVKEGKIIFFNRFNVVTWEDIVYFVLLVLNKEEIRKDNEILLMDFAENLEIDKLKEFISEEFGKVSENLDKHFTFKGMKLCV